MQQPFFSICIPTYNRANYLKRCIDSVIAGGESNIEILVQDNDSEDNTQEVIQSYSDKRIKYEKNASNVGLVNNFFLVHQRITGKYSLLITDDDMLLPGSLLKIKPILEKHQPEIFKTSLIRINDQHGTAYNYRLSDQDLLQPNLLSPKEQSKLFLLFHVFSGVGLKNGAFPTQWMKENNKDNIYPSLFLAAYYFGKISYIAWPTILHTHGNEVFWGSVNQDDFKKLAESQAEVIKFLHGSLDPKQYFSLLKEYVYIRKRFPASLKETLTTKQHLHLASIALKERIKNKIK